MEKAQASCQHRAKTVLAGGFIGLPIAVSFIFLCTHRSVPGGFIPRWQFTTYKEHTTGTATRLPAPFFTDRRSFDDSFFSTTTEHLQHAKGGLHGAIAYEYDIWEFEGRFYGVSSYGVVGCETLSECEEVLSKLVPFSGFEASAWLLTSVCSMFVGYRLMVKRRRSKTEKTILGEGSSI